jgi:hypothetical protein
MKTSRVKDIETYWSDPPPERSPRCTEWLTKIEAGWKPNRRVRQRDDYGSAEFFGVWLWEYLYVLSPALLGQPPGLPLFDPKPVPPVALTVSSGSASPAFEQMMRDVLAKVGAPEGLLAKVASGVLPDAVQTTQATKRQLDMDHLVFGNAFYEDTPTGRRRVDPATVRRLPSGEWVEAGTSTPLVHVREEAPTAKYGSPRWATLPP